MRAFFSWVDEVFVSQHVKLRNISTLLLITFFLSRAVHAGPFEQGMTFLDKGDFAEAFCLWRPLAMQGHAEAAYHLGWLYANGNGLKVDMKQAIHWWTQASSQGHTDAQFAIGLAYTHGEGIKADPATALDWYIKAANGGHQDAQDMVRTMIFQGSSEVQERLGELTAKKWLGRPIRVIVDKAKLRSGPGKKFSEVGMLEKDVVLTATGKRGDWYQVVKDGDKVSFGWIAGWLTEPVER